MYTLKHNLAILLTIIFTGIIGIYLVYQNSSSPTIPDFVKATASEPEFQTTSQPSSDGKVELTMKKTLAGQAENKDKMITYLFTVISKSDNISQSIFNQTVSTETSFLIFLTSFSIT